ncbi:lantibiotic dehydratase [Hymenobacter chitinivorans]|uniref:Thiopeptide-type bacteriocin biosynthesis protein n=1 Tax=Hymenobacter chitinivorans DSM 11115 TaxID=1121954 RepID=A0A2M9APU8_9BACT|nr:lantibiotic dehydratase [Hymenobacter chitinivorans]PJJ47720.1 thiopeptide-type bacteriocin biosynthesis protein [Hymenobacter chitinivorans DSM 11115]
MKHLYHFHPNLVLRTPAAPFDSSFDEAALQSRLQDAGFMEALYLASPDLCQECRKWLSGELTDPKKIEKLQSTVARYYARMSSRSTPFGLFAGCSVLRWGSASRITLAPEHNSRHTRLDMHYLCALAYQLSELAAVKERIRYFPNTSIYQIGQEVRYIEHRYVEEERVHQISSATASATLLQVIDASRAGCTRRELSQQLADDEQELASAQTYVDQLIQAQVLVSELEPTVTGPEFYTHLQTVLARLQAGAPDALLDTLQTTLLEVAQLLHTLDQNPVNSAAAYEQIVDELLPLGIPIQKNKLFQTDSIRGLQPEATLSTAVQEQLLEALDVLTFLATPHRNERLEDFKERFQARYEGQAVPLLEALDNESGLRYSDFGKSTYSPLVHDLALAGPGSKARSLRQNEVQHFMYHKLREADRNHQYSVEITRAEVQGFTAVANPLPPSLPVMFRLLDEGQILLENAGGSSAVNLLGRFAHADSRIEQIIHEVTCYEQDQNPGVAFAEIAHLPVSRVGNILLRPAFRDFEIPYLAQAGRPAEGQIRLQDLTLAMQGQQLIIRSRLTNQIIVPRLSTAHNFTHQALPVYEFLCDLQTQGLQHQLGFSWSAVSLYAKFLPRLTFRQVVLQPASWQLDRTDLQSLLAASAAELQDRLREFRRRWQLPRFFTLADGDNELLVDADNPTSVGVWLAAIRSRPLVKLKEFLFAGAASPVQDAQGRAYVHQFVGLLLRKVPCYTALGRTKTSRQAEVVREFSMGSEWLYYKFYCGQKVADRVLIDIVRPLTEELLRQGLIDKWFFIRYADPDNHIRLRLHLSDVQRIGSIVHLVNACVQPYVSNGYIWKTQIDTYRRELERYGSSSMELSESLFFENSRAVLSMLAETAGDDSANLWVWGLHQIDELLDAFDCPLAEKLALLHSLKESFGREFGMDKNLKLQLDAKYRSFRPTIQQALWQQTLSDGTTHKQRVRSIAQQINALGRQGELEVERPNLLSSYIHMLLNRLIPVDARLHEMVLYDFLHRQYQSQQAQQKSSQVPA